MDAVILACGPSLADAPLAFPGCEILAVNGAMDHDSAHGAHWWVAHDLWTGPLPIRKPRRGMVTSWAAITEGQDRMVPGVDLIDFRQSRFADAVRISTSAAIYWAAELMARDGEGGSIIVYGSEMQGDRHWDGSEAGNYDDWSLARADVRRAISRIPYTVRGIPWIP